MRLKIRKYVKYYQSSPVLALSFLSSGFLAGRLLTGGKIGKGKMTFLEFFTVAKLGKSEPKQLLRMLIVGLELVGLVLGGYKLVHWLVDMHYFFPAVLGLVALVVVLFIAASIVLKADGEL